MDYPFLGLSILCFVILLFTILQHLAHLKTVRELNENYASIYDHWLEGRSKTTDLEKKLVTALGDAAQTAIELKKLQEKKDPLARDAADLLHELTATGSALVRITPVDSSNLFMRAPR